MIHGRMSDPAAPVRPFLFSVRLTAALAILGLIAALQGGLAIWAVGLAEKHVQRGRVAADIQHAFVVLSSDKQRLRTWVAQRQFGAGAADTMRDELLANMLGTLRRLDELSRLAVGLDESPAARQRQAERGEALKVLDRSLVQLAQGLAKAPALTTDADAASAWMAAQDLFDKLEGRDLRRLLSDSLVREEESVREKRIDTDVTLGWLRSFWFGSTAALLMAALLLAAYFARALSKPLLRLSQGAQALGAGDLAHRIPVDTFDEFSQAARSMNGMAEELAAHRGREREAREVLEKEVEARTAELTAALDTLHEGEARRRRLLADISHELRTPTTAIRGEAQVTLRGSDKPIIEYKGSLQRIADTAHQLGLVIDDLLTMAKSDMDALSLNRKTINLVGVLDDVVSHGAAMARAGQVQLAHEAWPDPLPMSGDADRLRQLLLILIDNAVRYSRPGGTIKIAARRIHEGADWIAILVEDNGIGIEDDELGLIFERNHRTARARLHSPEGSGLGLPIARFLAHRHGGDISISSGTQGGTTAMVMLPLMAESRRLSA
jgi:signal transduction histidine kinase